MKGQLKLVVFIFVAFAIAEGARFVGAQSTTLNPNRTIGGDVIFDKWRGGLFGATTGQAISTQTAFGAGVATSTVTGLNGTVTELHLERIRSAIRQGSTASNGRLTLNPSGVAVTGLMVLLRDGKAILRGTVHSEKERADVGARAAGVVGGDKVVNEILVR